MCLTGCCCCLCSHFDSLWRAFLSCAVCLGPCLNRLSILLEVDSDSLAPEPISVCLHVVCLCICVAHIRTLTKPGETHSTKNTSNACHNNVQCYGAAAHFNKRRQQFIQAADIFEEHGKLNWSEHLREGIFECVCYLHFADFILKTALINIFISTRELRRTVLLMMFYPLSAHNQYTVLVWPIPWNDSNWCYTTQLAPNDRHDKWQRHLFLWESIHSAFIEGVSNFGRF